MKSLRSPTPGTCAEGRTPPNPRQSPPSRTLPPPPLLPLLPRWIFRSCRGHQPLTVEGGHGVHHQLPVVMKEQGDGAPTGLATSPPTKEWRAAARSSSVRASELRRRAASASPSLHNGSECSWSGATRCSKNSLRSVAPVSFAAPSCLASGPRSSSSAPPSHGGRRAPRETTCQRPWASP